MKLKNNLKHLLFKMPRNVTRTFYLIYNYFKFPDYRESKITCGNRNPDKIFYVIRPRPGNIEGLMALFLDVIKQLEYADRNKYIPVVDFKNYETQYFTEDKNAWEIYFEQVSPYTLDEVYTSKNVVLSGLNVLERAPKYLNQKFDDKSVLQTRRLVSKYIRISKLIEDKVEKESQNLDICNCIGLYLRGTDYVKMRPAGHPIQPSSEQAIEKINKMQFEELKSIFLVTEDEEIKQKIVNYYGERVKTISDDLYISNYDGKDFLSKHSSIDELGSNNSERGITYLVKLCLLSKCMYMIAGNTSGSWASCVLSKNMNKNDMFIFDLGKY